MRLESLGMPATEVSYKLHWNSELLIYPPETLPSRLENVRCLTSMSDSQAKHMFCRSVRCLMVSNGTISASVKTLTGNISSLHECKLYHACTIRKVSYYSIIVESLKFSWDGLGRGFSSIASNNKVRSINQKDLCSTCLRASCWNHECLVKELVLQ